MSCLSMPTLPCSSPNPRLLGEHPFVAGAKTPVQRYLAAFAALGVPARAAPAKAAAWGLYLVARAAGLVG